jgi:hypothetical protein
MQCPIWLRNAENGSAMSDMVYDALFSVQRLIWLCAGLTWLTAPDMACNAFWLCNAQHGIATPGMAYTPDMA